MYCCSSPLSSHCVCCVCFVCQINSLMLYQQSWVLLLSPTNTLTLYLSFCFLLLCSCVELSLCSPWWLHLLLIEFALFALLLLLIEFALFVLILLLCWLHCVVHSSLLCHCLTHCLTHCCVLLLSAVLSLCWCCSPTIISAVPGYLGALQLLSLQWV